MNKKKLLPTRVFTMPALAPAASLTLRLLQQAHVEPVRIVRIMESDPDWAAEVLRQAHSPVWGMNAAPADLRDAIGLFGLRRFYQLVAVSAVGPLLRAPLPGYGLAAGELWDHSMAVAVATREILLEKGLKPCEEAFTAALLHDVGKLVLGTVLESDPEGPFSPAVADDGVCEEAERRLAGMDHAEAGATLLDHWRMPYWLVAAVRSHHAPLDSSFLIADLVHLADSLCRSGGRDSNRDGETTRRWSLPRRSLERIVGRTQETIAGVRELSVAGEGR